MYKYTDFNKKVFEFVANGAKILDVGCATGSLGREIKKSKNPQLLIGIDSEKELLKEARKYYDKVYIADIEKGLNSILKNNKFDIIVLADVLEHLKTPDRLLLQLKKFLSKNGYFLISVPNFVFIENRIKLGLGKFSYTDHGLLDKTHLRFYTKQSILKLIENCGLKTIQLKGYINTRKSLNFLDLLAQFWPEMFAYQFLIIARQ